MAPLLAPETLATPALKLIAVALPKSVAVPQALETVGAVARWGCWRRRRR